MELTFEASSGDAWNNMYFYLDILKQNIIYEFI